MDIAKKILTELEKKKMTQSEFARQMGISRQNLSTTLRNWRNGVTPNIKTLQKYAETLEKDIKDFI